MKVDFVDLEWLNEDGMLYDRADVEKITQKFQQEKVEALFVPHCNFGNEDAIAQLAKDLNLPTLLWGPRDESPLPNGVRLRDSQCGLFATSKVLMRFGVPFTYIENCRLNDPVFEKGLLNFLAAACVVKNFKKMRIGQISTRPSTFLSVMYNESELLEQFGIQVVLITLNEIVDSMNWMLMHNADQIVKDAQSVKKRVCVGFEDEALHKIIALKYAIADWARKEKLNAVAIQCWDALQSITGVMPCFANSELPAEGLPVACETDIMGAISSVMAQAAVMGKTPSFFADVTIRHPDNDNAELLWHCGPFPLALKKEAAEARLGEYYVLESKCPGINEWEIKGGEISILRLDSFKGNYSVLTAVGKGVDGPKNRGTYVWVEFRDWPELEKRIINGPYIHHVVGVHSNIVPVIEEALKYIPGIRADFFK